MQEFVARKNIERYRTLLSSNTLDEPMRKQVQRLLAQELAAMAEIENHKQAHPEPKQSKQIG